MPGRPAALVDGAVNPGTRDTDRRGCIHGLVARILAPIERSTIIFVWSLVASRYSMPSVLHCLERVVHGLRAWISEGDEVAPD